MNSDPLVAARIRAIQDAATARRKKREDAEAAEAARKQHAEAERRQQVSPRDLERQAQAKANWDYWERIYKQDQDRDYRENRSAAIKEMANLKAEWDQPETTETRRQHILRMYGEIYRRYEDDKTRKPTTTSDETILAYWKSEKRKAALARIYSGVTA